MNSAFRKARVKWAGKLLRARYFVVLTDKESVICLDGVDPRSFTDILALTAQAESLKAFAGRLKDIQAEHIKASDKLLSGKPNKRKAAGATKSRKKSGQSRVTKIKVKQG